MSVTYTPYDYEIHHDPFPTYRRLRDEAPAYHNEAAGFWALSRYDDVRDAFRDTQRFSSSHGVTLDPLATGPHAHKTMFFLAMDPPEHTQMRALVSRGFTPRRVVDLAPSIEALCAEHIDTMLQAAADGAPVDFITEFAGRVPMDVISEMLGVPRSDRAELRRLADLLVHREEGVHDVPASGIEAAFTLSDYYANMIAERRANPTDDLTSALCQAEIDGERLTDEHVRAALFLFVVAGNETTTKLLGNAMYWLGQHPEQRARVWSDASLVEPWIEETLRFDNSTQLLARLATEDIELHGRVIPEGARVLLLIGAANRDERVFSRPDDYLPGRDTSKSLSFGVGRHFCLGASLARLEAKIALAMVRERVARFELAGEPSRVHSVNVRGFAHLPLAITAA